MIIVRTKQQQRVLKKQGYNSDKRLQSIKVKSNLNIPFFNYVRIWVYTKKNIKDELPKKIVPENIELDFDDFEE